MVIVALRPFFLGPAHKREALALYITLARQSRNPFFYTRCAVPDTLDGRFDMLVLHLFLTLRLLVPGQAAQAAPKSPSLLSPGRENKLTRLLLECLFDDMDRSLREMGVGDMGVGKRVRAMSKAAFGRLKAYRDSWGDDAALGEALKRNVYRGADVAPEAVGQLVEYMRQYQGGELA